VVAWWSSLEEITVTGMRSDSFYHYHDNRVMPPHVDEELAREEGEGALVSGDCCDHAAQQLQPSVDVPPACCSYAHIAVVAAQELVRQYVLNWWLCYHHGCLLPAAAAAAFCQRAAAPTASHHVQSLLMAQQWTPPAASFHSPARAPASAPLLLPGWWLRTLTSIIDELNINSAVGPPLAPDEVLPTATNTMYPMTGYAYTGMHAAQHGETASTAAIKLLLTRCMPALGAVHSSTSQLSQLLDDCSALSNCQQWGEGR